MRLPEAVVGNLVWKASAAASNWCIVHPLNASTALTWLSHYQRLAQEQASSKRVSVYTKTKIQPRFGFWENWFWAVVTALLGFAFLWSPSEFSLIASVLLIALGIRIFWAHGGHQVTAAGLYGLATAVFAGFAGLYWVVADPRVAQQVSTMLLWMFLSLAAMYLFIWVPRQPNFAIREERGGGQSTMPRIMALLVAGGLITASSVLDTESLVHITAGSMVFLISGLMVSGRDATRLLRGFAAAGVVILFWLTIFTVFGRLILVSLVLTGAVIYSGLRSRKNTKAIVILGSPAALAGLVALRANELTGAGRNYDGLGSVVNPLRDLADLSGAINNGAVATVNGETFVATLLFWFPRAWWPEKPPGLGAELTALLRPELLISGHSMAAHAIGEWIYNFGPAGVFLMVPFVGVGVKFLDAMLARVQSLDVPAPTRVALTAAVATVVAEIPTLVWVGSFTFTARAGQRVAMIAVLWAMSRWLHTAEVRRPSSFPRTRVRRPQSPSFTAESQKFRVEEGGLGRADRFQGNGEFRLGEKFGEPATGSIDYWPPR